MFAEELSGNASRRRQDANRERRRKLKQEQQKKAQQQKKEEAKRQDTATATATTATATTATATTATAIATTATATSKSALNVTKPGHETVVKNNATLPSGNKKLSAVEIANAQRQQRLEAQAQKTACTKIQSFYRAHRSNCSALEEQAALLTSRLRDLSTLRDILKEKANTNYIPPPATCTALCQQIVFLSQYVPYKVNTSQHCEIVIKLRNIERDSILVQQIYELVLIPGLSSPDENVNPFAVWLQSSNGMKRIQSMIRLALFTVTNSLVNSVVQKSCLDFLKVITMPTSISNTATANSERGSAPSILNFCCPLLLPIERPKNGTTTAPAKSQGYAANKTPSMDLITLLRHHLLYTTGGAPIPLTASKLRESCIPLKQREQADALFQTILAIIRTFIDKSSNRIGFEANSSRNLSESLMSRFVSEILTIPILTWKVSEFSIKMMISTEQDASLHPDIGEPFLVSLIKNFTGVHRRAMNAGDVESILCSDDIPLKKSNATPIQCLLANAIQIGRSCTLINGSQREKVDFEASITYFRFLTTLVDAIPISTFSSRDSVVEWVTDGGHHCPVVISPIILEHCRVLTADSWVRKLFQCAIDPVRFRTDEILKEKTKQDLKMEKEVFEARSSSVTSLAAKEARVDRNRSFWKSSAWARNLTKGVSKILNSNKGSQNKTRTASTIPSPQDGKLIDASAVSRDLALGGSDKRSAKQVLLAATSLPLTTSADSRQPSSYTPELFKVLCGLYGIIIARWGGNGGEDIVRQKRISKKDSKRDVATISPEPCVHNILNVLCFSTEFLRFSWSMIQVEKLNPTVDQIPMKSLCIRPTYGTERDDYPGIFYLFVESLSHQLILTDDTEIHDMERPLPIHQLRRCIVILKQLLYKASCVDEVSLSNPDSKPDGRITNYFGLALIKASSKAMWDLYDRSSRRLICAPNLWIINDLMEKELRACNTENDYISLLSAPVLRVCPFLVSFKRRLRLFERIVYTNRAQIQGENSANPFHTNPLKPGIPVRITRGRILEDGLATMNNLGRDMRRRISIQYYNEAGAKESGIDAGGLFKEFWTDLCAIAFDPNYALFRVTEDNFMYPNPSSGAAHGVDHIGLFKFLGRILGKSLYESITVHPQFAHFFLSFLRGDYNYLHMFSDLSTIDSQLYNNLMFLKTYEGDAEDLCLTFTVSVDDFGGTREIPLLPNGANIDVTNANKHRYIGLVTKYYVVDRVKEQSEALTQGLWEVIDKSWLHIFNEPELQVLISGASDGKIDVEDMRAHTRYAGGFTIIDRNVTRFWSVFSSMTSKQQANLLRFVTSCERPPPLGFATLTPPFTIQRVGIMKDGDKLPSASTCFNVLKLPTYSSEKVMKERLIYAIESGAGFELS